MSGRRRSTLSPSLFPFLAVLVCTLGTLILLLALVAQNAATAAVAQAEKQVEPKPTPDSGDDDKPKPMTADKAGLLLEEADFRLEELVRFREAQTEDLGKRRDQLTQIESHMDKIRKRLERLNREIELATSDEDIDPVDENELLTLRQRLLQEKDSLNKLRAEKSNQIPRVALIPHKGPNGTDRRPVYLECTQSGIKIWPEGSELEFHHLSESVPGANPLDAALRVVRHHAMNQYRDPVAPYPLLVVRPDGIETYAAARVALKDWDDQFGYELVPAGVKLAYDDPDPQLKRRMDEAIRAATIKQHGLSALARRAGQKFGGVDSRGNRVYPRLSASSMDRMGRSSGYADHREGFNRRTLRTMQQQSQIVTQNSPHSAGSGSAAARKLDQHLKEVARDMRLNGAASHPFDSNDIASNPFGQIGKEALSALDGQAHPGGNHGRSNLVTGTGGPNSPSGQSDTRFAGDPQSQPSGQPGQPGQSENRGLSATEQAYANAQTNQYLNPNIPNSTAQSQRQQQANPYTANAAQGNQFGSGQSASPASQNAASRQNAATASSASGSASSAPPRAAMALSPPQSAGSQSRSSQSSSQQAPQNLQNQSATREIVRRQGADWALPKSVAISRGNSIVRTIRVECFPDRLVLLPAPRGGAMEMFGLSDENMNRATLELASAVRDRIDRWGAALPGGRWQPRLQVDVKPGGEERFHQLQRLMTGSGVDIQGRSTP